MAFPKSFARFSLSTILLLAVSMQFVHSFPASLEGEEGMAPYTARLATPQVEKQENGVLFLGVGAEDSARQVPSGPDPLHHNANPTGPLRP